MVLVLSEALDHPSVRRARIVFGQRPREINSQCSRKIQVSQQALFARQGVNAGQKLLYSVEVGFSFRRNQLVFPFLSRIMSLLRDAGRVLRRVRGTDPEKSRFFQESFILPRRTVEVKTDRTACRDFLGGNHSANHQSVAEHHPAAWLQYAKHFGQHAESSGNMAQNVIREHGVKGRFVEGKILGSVTLLEMCLGSKPRRLCKLLRIANSGFIDVQPYDLAAQLFCKMQSISPGTATDLQYGGIAAQTKQLGNFQ